MSLWDYFKAKDCSQVTAQKDKQIQDLTNSLSNLTAQFDSLSIDNIELKHNYENSANMVKTLQIEKDNLTYKITQLTAQLVVAIPPVPDLKVDWTKIPYLPTTYFYYYNQKQAKIIGVYCNFSPSKFLKVWDDRIYNFVWDAYKPHMNEPLKDKLVFLRNLVLTKCVYQNDFNEKGALDEDWKMPLVTYYEGVGDCECLTNLFLTFCKIVGIPSNKVFNLTGVYVNQDGTETGHSFGGFIDENNLLYIIECTNNNPIVRMIGSNYKCKGSLSGIFNWDLMGKPLQEQI